MADAALAFARRAANHAGNFLRALLFVKARHLGARRSVFVVFADQILRIRHRGNLRQMRHADHLMMIADLAHLFGHNLRHAPADARIDFIKNHASRNAGLLRRKVFERQHDAG